MDLICGFIHLKPFGRISTKTTLLRYHWHISSMWIVKQMSNFRVVRMNSELSVTISVKIIKAFQWFMVNSKVVFTNFMSVGLSYLFFCIGSRFLHLKQSLNSPSSDPRSSSDNRRSVFYGCRWSIDMKVHGLIEVI